MTATVVLVSPPCATTAAWSRVVPLLDELAIPNVSVQLPSCLPESEAGDATHLRSVLETCDHPVVLVGHSSGGLPITEVGDQPTVQRLVYLDAVMWDLDEPMALDGAVDEEFAACVRYRRHVAEFDVQALARYLLAGGWSTTDAHEFVAGFRPQRHIASVRTLTNAAWRSVPSTFVRPLDSVNARHLQDRFASRATEVIDIQGDHFPHWRRPQEIADLLTGIALRVAR